jgi:hypothetical protein
METNTNEEELVYSLQDDKQIENINVDYRNSNYKFIKINYNDKLITLKQDYKLGKGGIFWDGVIEIFILVICAYESY